MSVKLYMDVHVKKAVTAGLRRRGVDVFTAQEDGTARLNDSELLDRASSLGRVLFSQDDDLLREATRRQQSATHFAGVVYAHQLNISLHRRAKDANAHRVARSRNEVAHTFKQRQIRNAKISGPAPEKP